MGNIDIKTGIWEMNIAKKRHKCDLLLTAAIGNSFTPNSIADLGCGDGRYCCIFKAFGWSIVHGYEGTPKIKELGIYDDITFIDLTKKRYVDIDYDLVVCLEVGEHIPQQYEQVFIDNVCEFSRNIVISWALPGQYSASGHVNCKPTDYIIDQFGKRKFKLNKTKTYYLRDNSEFSWFKKTMMVFEEK